ncbi:MAG: glycosyltransferase family 4 protein [Chloroflexi bacterium]|nr:glycosyltransferase family 4 protein [Chloroflexota bacterium]
MSTKICFVALSAYPLLAGRSSKRVIGPSVHTVLLAKELLKRNFDVTFITYDEGGLPIENIDGIEVIKTYREDSHLNPAFKALLIWKAMRKAKAYIYYHHAGASGIVPSFCRLMKKKSVWHIASNFYVNKGLKNFKLLDRFAAWLDIKLADVIIAQSEFQKTELKRNYGRDSLEIKNHFPLTRGAKPEKTKLPIILWVGTISATKQPELFLRLAEAIPEAALQLIGGVGDTPGLYERVKETSAGIPNLKFLDVVPFNEINEYFSRAVILVNTSTGEGFPYAYIQAWMNYIPVVSLNSDPDEVICKYKLGFHSKTFPRLEEDVRMLLENEQLRQQMGENARRYVEDNHDINNIVKQHIEVFNQLSKIQGRCPKK